MDHNGPDDTEAPLTGAAGHDDGQELMHLQVRLPSQYEGEIRYANHLAVSFNGYDFVLTIAQIPLPMAASPEEFLALVGPEPLAARILDQFAVPPDRFVDAIDRFVVLLTKMRNDGLIAAKPEDGP